ncbi:MAG: ribonuclease III [Clostridiales bacterium]|nr:ribonuclease III [Clostridiales bacterium]
MIFEIAEIERRIGYVFRDKLLLRKCFTHASYAHEQGEENNELLEFFGDAILDYIVTEYLVENEKGDEGVLTKRRAEFVAKTPLQEAVFSLGLNKYLLLGTGLAKNPNYEDKMYSSLYESLVAGIYIDGGVLNAKKFIINTLIKNKKVSKKVKTEKVQDFKSKFQELVQKKKLGTIRYEDVKKTGPDHAPTFEVALYLNDQKISSGKGQSKKQAEMKSAEKALQYYKKGRKR